MDNLLFCLNATVPIFLLMVFGYFFRKTSFFSDAFVSTANKFVFHIALPVLVFKDLCTTDFVSVWNGSFVLFCAIATLISIGLAYCLSIIFQKSYSRHATQQDSNQKNKFSQGEFIQAAYRSSAALLGIALIQNIYGTTGMAPLMIIGSVPLYNIMAVLVLEFFKPKKEPLHKEIFLHTAKGILTNPILIAMIVGILWSLLHIPMPSMFSKTLGYVSNLATPLGLMAMGASFDFKKAFGCLPPALVCTFMKLIGFAAIFLPIAVGLGFRDSQMIAILVMLGSATTVSSYVMSKNMGHEGILSASVVMLTTLFSAFTLTFWLYILKAGGYV